MTSILRYFVKTIKLQLSLIVAVFHISVFFVHGITANFTYTINSKCAPAIAIFTNQSAPGLTYIWNFGTGDTVIAKDMADKEVSYPDTGHYIVSLKVISSTETASFF